VTTTPFSLAAVLVERGAGLVCGACGALHATSADDMEVAGERCVCCGPCSGHWAELFRRNQPDLVGASGVITRAAFDEAMRRLDVEIARMDAEIAAMEAEMEEHL
jgi:ferredoxin